MKILATVDDLLEDVLGKYCSCCQRLTSPYEAEGGTWPCCSGCWHAYEYWTPITLAQYAELVDRYRSAEYQAGRGSKVYLDNPPPVL